MGSLELRIPPVVVLLVCAGLMWLVSKGMPTWSFDLPGKVVLALLLFLLGVGSAVTGVIAFRRAATTVDPRYPDGASKLVVTGIYRRTRNPMYLGMLLVLLGWASLMANPLTLPVVAVFPAYLNRFQIAPEERVLAKNFGEAYRAYCRSTGRWL